MTRGHRCCLNVTITSLHVSRIAVRNSVCVTDMDTRTGGWVTCRIQEVPPWDTESWRCPRGIRAECSRGGQALLRRLSHALAHLFVPGSPWGSNVSCY